MQKADAISLVGMITAYVIAGCVFVQFFCALIAVILQILVSDTPLTEPLRNLAAVCIILPLMSECVLKLGRLLLPSQTFARLLNLLTPSPSGTCSRPSSSPSSRSSTSACFSTYSSSISSSSACEC